MNMVDKRCSCCGGENPEKVQIDAILAKYQGKKGSLIPILQEVQALYNYLPKDALEYIASSTGTPIAQIYGVVTFYSQFHLNPRGRNIIRVCQGTACHVRVCRRAAGTLACRYSGRECQSFGTRECVVSEEYG